MDWLAFSYSLPSKEGSSPRVMVWRRLKRLGTLPLAGGVQILPSREECLEAFQWLAQEIKAANGEASILRVTHLEGITDQQIIKLFSAARIEDYRQIEVQTNELKRAISVETSIDIPEMRENLNRLHRHLAETMRIDYFNSSEGKRIALLLEDIEQEISPDLPEVNSTIKVNIDDYRNKTWVTRPHPHVDRLACAWFIRRFINPKAVIRYSNSPEPDEISFDMKNDHFGHRGNLCTLETMMLAFSLENSGLKPIAEIVHEIDLHDDHYVWPEIAGIERLLDGWSTSDLSDPELEEKGISLFEGLFSAFTCYSQSND